MTNEELIAEARQEVSIHDKLGDGFSEGSEERAFYYGHRDRYKRLADALEASEARVKVLEAQVASIGVVNPGGVAKQGERPDDSECNQLIAEAESFVDAILEIGEKYGVPLTNNMERWQDGVFLRYAGDFCAEVREAALRFLVAPLEARIAELEARVKDFKCEQVFRISEMQELLEAQQRIAELEAKVAARQPSENDYEAMRIAVGRVVRDVMNFPQAVQARLLGQDMSPLRDALVGSVVEAGFSRAAVPDAATEASGSSKTLADEYLELLHDLQTKYVKDTDILFLARKKAEAERDAALAAIERVRAIHHPDPMAPEWCVCEERVPCSAVAALNGAPEPEGKP